MCVLRRFKGGAYSLGTLAVLWSFAWFFQLGHVPTPTQAAQLDAGASTWQPSAFLQALACQSLTTAWATSRVLCLLSQNTTLQRGPPAKLPAHTTIRGQGDACCTLNEKGAEVRCGSLLSPSPAQGLVPPSQLSTSGVWAPAAPIGNARVASPSVIQLLTPSPPPPFPTATATPLEDLPSLNLASLLGVFVLPVNGILELCGLRIEGAALPVTYPLPTVSFLALSAFNLTAALAGRGPGQPPPLILSNLVIVTPSCTSLSLHQALACSLSPSPNFTVTPTSLLVHSFTTPTASITNVTLTCTAAPWPPPPPSPSSLSSSSSSSTTLASPPSPLLLPAIPFPCLAGKVSSGAELLDAMTSMDLLARAAKAHSSLDVVLAHLYLDADYISLEPQPQPLVKPQRGITIDSAAFLLVGRDRGDVAMSAAASAPSASTSVTVLDLRGVAGLVVVSGGASVELRRLVLRGAPLGLPTEGELAYLRLLLWTFDFPRLFLGNSRRTLLTVTNATFELPREELALWFYDNLGSLEAMPEGLRGDLCVHNTGRTMATENGQVAVVQVPGKGPALMWRAVRSFSALYQVNNVLLTADGDDGGARWWCGVSAAEAVTPRRPPTLQGASSSPSSSPAACSVCPARSRTRPTLCAYVPEGVCGVVPDLACNARISNMPPGGANAPLGAPVGPVMPWTLEPDLLWRDVVKLTLPNGSTNALLRAPAKVLMPTTMMGSFLAPVALDVALLPGAIAFVDSNGPSSNTSRNASLTVRAVVLVNLPSAGNYSWFVPPIPSKPPQLPPRPPPLPWPPQSLRPPPPPLALSAPPSPRSLPPQPPPLQPPRQLTAMIPSVPQQPPLSLRRLMQRQVGGLGGWPTAATRGAVVSADACPRRTSLRLGDGDGGRCITVAARSVAGDTGGRALLQAAAGGGNAGANTDTTGVQTQGLDHALTNFTSCLWVVNFDRAAAVARHALLASPLTRAPTVSSGVAVDPNRPMGLPYVFLDSVMAMVPQPELDVLVWAWAKNSTAAATADGLADQLAQMLAGSRLSAESAAAVAAAAAGDGTAVTTLVFDQLWWCGLEGFNVTFTSQLPQVFKGKVNLASLPRDLPVDFNLSHRAPLAEPDPPSPPSPSLLPAALLVSPPLFGPGPPVPPGPLPAAAPGSEASHVSALPKDPHKEPSLLGSAAGSSNGHQSQLHSGPRAPVIAAASVSAVIGVGAAAALILWVVVRRQRQRRASREGASTVIDPVKPVLGRAAAVLPAGMFADCVRDVIGGTGAELARVPGLASAATAAMAGLAGRLTRFGPQSSSVYCTVTTDVIGSRRYGKLKRRPIGGTSWDAATAGAGAAHGGSCVPLPPPRTATSPGLAPHSGLAPSTPSLHAAPSSLSSLGVLIALYQAMYTLTVRVAAGSSSGDAVGGGATSGDGAAGGWPVTVIQDLSSARQAQGGLPQALGPGPHGAHLGASSSAAADRPVQLAEPSQQGASPVDPEPGRAGGAAAGADEGRDAGGCRPNAAEGEGSSKPDAGGSSLVLTITGELGRGAQGVVYRGVWRDLDVAVKSRLLQRGGLLLGLEGGGGGGEGSGGEGGGGGDVGSGLSSQGPHHGAIQEAAISASVSHANVVATYTYSLQPLRAFGDSVRTLPPPQQGSHEGVSSPQGAASGGEVSIGVASELVVWRLTLVQELCDGGSLRHCLEQGTLARCRLLVEVPRPCSGGSGEALGGVWNRMEGVRPAAAKTPPLAPTATGLATQQQQQQLLDPRVTLMVALQAARGLAHLHSSAIVHADVSSANILLKGVKQSPHPPQQQAALPPTGSGTWGEVSTGVGAWMGVAAAGQQAGGSGRRGAITGRQGGVGAPGTHRRGLSGGAATAATTTTVAAGAAAAFTDPFYYGFVAKVGDFGLSERLDGSTEASHFSGLARGVSAYTAPELVRLGRASPAGDVYAFAVVLWELAMGRPLPALLARPEGAALQAWLTQQARTDPQAVEPLPPGLLTWPSGTPPGLVGLVGDCLQEDPAARPTAQQLYDRLHMLLTGHMPSSSPSRSQPPSYERQQQEQQQQRRRAHSTAGESAMTGPSASGPSLDLSTVSWL